MQDPTESLNLAQAPTPEVAKLIAEMVALRDALEVAPDTVGDLGWIFGFRDPTGKNVDSCMGPKTGSSFCGYGAEFSCAVMGALLKGDAIGHASNVILERRQAMLKLYLLVVIRLPRHEQRHVVERIEPRHYAPAEGGGDERARQREGDGLHDLAGVVHVPRDTPEARAKQGGARHDAIGDEATDKGGARRPRLEEVLLEVGASGEDPANGKDRDRRGTAQR